MKFKKIIIFFILIIISTNLFCENFSLDGKYRFTVYSGLARIDISGNNLKYVYQKEENPDKILNFTIIHIDGLLFFKLHERFPKEVTEEYLYNNKKDVLTDDKFLILAGKTTKSKNVIFLATTTGFDKNYPCTESIISEKVQAYKDCSSFLVEKNKEYHVSNLQEQAVDTPWVEAADGSGIGEGFTLVNEWNKKYPYLLIMNGYISYEKPYLYKQNNRVKKIKVTGLKSGKSKVLDVLDTPHPQTVDISFITEPEDIRVEIADVYKGTKYDDTCLHFCVTYDDEVIPYENSVVE